MLKNKILKLCFSLLLLLVIVFGFSNIVIFAAENGSDDFVGYSSLLSRDELQEETTTTYFTNINYEENDFDYTNTNIQVDDSEPLLTVLVHGYGSNASVWSNNFEFFSEEDLRLEKKDEKFTYDSDSLIERLRNITEANIYCAEMMTSSSFVLYKLPELSDNLLAVQDSFSLNGSITNDELDLIDYKNNGEIIKQINDISKHSVVIFKSKNSRASNDDVYEEFDYMMDKIVYDIRTLNSNNKLPKVNLIAHSRGGLTALQYTFDHSALVENVFTIGSPFSGSKL